MRKKICILFVVIMLIFSLFNIAFAADRPNTIEDFIKQYNIIINEKYLETIDSTKISQELENEVWGLNDASLSGGDQEVIKTELAKIYDRIKKDSSDDLFLEQAKFIAYYYIVADDASTGLENNAEKDENGNIDYAKTFDKLKKEYDNATTTSTKSAIFSQIYSIWPELTSEQKQEKVDGDSTRSQLFTNMHTEVNEANKNELDKPVDNDKSTGIAGVEERNKTTDQIVSDANDFVSNADISNTVDQQDFEEGISKIYNILFAIGMVIAVIWGVILGIKFLYDSTEGKAEIKEQLLPYVIGVFIIFGAFGIWKIVLEIMKIVA